MISSWCEAVFLFALSSLLVFMIWAPSLIRLLQIECISNTAIELLRGKTAFKLRGVRPSLQLRQRSQIVFGQKLGLNMQTSDHWGPESTRSFTTSDLLLSHAAQQPPPPIPVTLILFPSQPEFQPPPPQSQQIFPSRGTSVYTCTFSIASPGNIDLSLVVNGRAQPLLRAHHGC